MARLISKTLIVLCFAAGLIAAQIPASADNILSDAHRAAGDRPVLVIFHASWCGWCKKFEKYLGSADIKPIADKYFVTTYVTVEERGEKKGLNTPGGDDLMKHLGGPAGLPFFAFLDPGGATIANSIRLGKNGKVEGNIGHPDKPYEVDWVMNMLAKAG